MTPSEPPKPAMWGGLLSSVKLVDESTLFGISIRAWLVLLLSATVCYMAVKIVKVEEPLYSAFMLSLGYYFGQKVSNK